MNCDQATQALSARADGETTNEQALDAHLAGCAACRAFEDSVGLIRRELRIAPVASEIDVSAAVLGAIEEQATVGSRHRGLLSVAAAAFFVAALSGAFLLGRNSRSTALETIAPAPSPFGEIEAEGPEAGTGGVLAVVWTRDELDPTVVEAMNPVVDEWSVVRRETVLLTRSTSESGSPVDVIDERWGIPLDVAAVEPATYSGVVEGSGAVATLQPGEGLLGETSAKLRHLGVGATLGFDDVDIVIVAVVPDEVVGAAELLVDENTGGQLGVTTPRYVLVRSDLTTMELSSLLDDAGLGDARVRTEGETAWLRNSDAVLPQAFIKQEFGEFAVRPAGDGFEVDPVWYADNIVSTELPGLGRLNCHRLIVPLLEEVLAGFDPTALDAVDAGGFEGCWNPRQVRATGDLSRHSWGAAIDLGALPDDAATAQRIVDGFAANGFAWGGDWLVPDPGHFEYVGATIG